MEGEISLSIAGAENTRTPQDDPPCVGAAADEIPFWAVLGPSTAHLKPISQHLGMGPSWSILGPVRSILVRFGGHLKAIFG